MKGWGLRAIITNSLAPRSAKRNSTYDYKSSGLEYNPDLTRELVDYLIEQKAQREVDEYIIKCGRGGWQEEVGKAVVGTVAANIDAVNLASILIPIGGQAWWATKALKYGAFKTVLARGAVEGVIGQTALEPVAHYEHNLEQREYSVQDSARNILASAAFGSTLNAAGYGVSYGFKKLKSKYYSTPEILQNSVSTDSSALNHIFKENIEALAEETYPADINHSSVHDSVHEFANKEVTPESKIPELQALKQNLREQGKDKFHKFFDFEDKVASVEQKLHEEFITNGDVDKIPNVLRKQLEVNKARLKQSYQEHLNNPEFAEVIENLQNLDRQITELLKLQQQSLNAYDLDPRDIYLAARQLDEGKLIDLEEPSEARSIFSQDSSTTEPIKSNEAVNKTEGQPLHKQVAHLTDELAKKLSLVQLILLLMLLQIREKLYKNIDKLYNSTNRN